MGGGGRKGGGGGVDMNIAIAMEFVIALALFDVVYIYF